MNYNQEELLLESRSMRDSLADRVDVLNKVKGLAMLQDDIHATTEQVANYYEVNQSVIKMTITNHRNELESDGIRVLKGFELKDFVSKIILPTNTGISSMTRSMTLIPRRAILRIGMLLRDSEVAKQVRNYLLNVEETARTEAPSIIEKAILKTESDLLLASAKWQVMAAQEIIDVKQRLEITEQILSNTVERTDNIVGYLTEVPDRAKINRKLKELARCFFSGRVDKATSYVYDILKDKYGIDVFQRVKNARNRLNEERSLQGKGPYADSTLASMVSGLDIVEAVGMINEMMEIIIGLLSTGYKDSQLHA